MTDIEKHEEALITARFRAEPLPGAPAELMARLGLAGEAPEARSAAVLAAAPVAASRPWRPLAGGLVAAALVVAVGFGLRPGGAPIARSPVPTVDVAASTPSEITDAILTYFDPDADPVDPLLAAY